MGKFFYTRIPVRNSRGEHGNESVSLQRFGGTALCGHRDLPYDDDKGVRRSFTRVVDRSQYGYGLDYHRMTIGPGLIFNLLLRAYRSTHVGWTSLPVGE